MKVTIDEARNVFGLRGTVEKEELRRRLCDGQQKLIAAYFALAESIDQPAQQEFLDGPEFARAFVMAMESSAPKRATMDAFVGALCAFVESRGVVIVTKFAWEKDGPPGQNQPNLLASVMSEMPNDTPSGVLDALRLFHEEIETSTRATISRLVDALKAIKKAKSWPK